MEFKNIYEDNDYAAAYARLEFSGTYMLAYRDLPLILKSHVTGHRALDFGCGAGRSSRFLRDLGLNVIGCDISQDMLRIARDRDPGGEYILIEPADFSGFQKNSFDLITAIFPFDNIPTEEEKLKNLSGLRDLLKRTGRLVILVSSAQIYLNEWETFTTKSWPENREAKSGDEVKIAVLNIGDARPVTDILWKEEDYKRLFKIAELELLKTFKPLADGSEPFKWISETTIAPWEIHLLKRASRPEGA
ncbi:class I SAM-dependent methyltransferase [Candidatus Acetothermia bacterium]|nr:class I SAM-dependent methyltransferase [Candidatus Acetothermia bacterium]MBI3642632.1 class I SAM-dependent methyltransferase [Candidatus Acetothermia bacterium]